MRAKEKPKKRPARVVKLAKKRKPATPKHKPQAKSGFDALTPKQQQFVAHYLANGLNATRAAIAAGYSPKTADSQASRMLKNAKVRRVVDERKEQGLAKLEITAGRVLEAIGKIAFAEGVLAGELEPVENKDKLKGLEMLGRHFKMFTDKVELKAKIERVVVREALKKEQPLPPAKPEF